MLTKTLFFKVIHSLASLKSILTKNFRLITLARLMLSKNNPVFPKILFCGRFTGFLAKFAVVLKT